MERGTRAGNSRLRSEIIKLKNELRDLNSNKYLEKNKQRKKSPLSRTERQAFLKKEIEHSLCPGIIKLGKMHSHKKIFINKSTSNCNIIDSLENPSLNNLKSISNQESGNDSFQKIERYPLTKIKHDVSNMNILGETLNRSEIKHSRYGSNGMLEVDNKERTLIDSFNSYYDSEQENLDKEGKCELSFQIYESVHTKGVRRRERRLLQEIESLREENTRLRDKLHNELRAKYTLNLLKSENNRRFADRNQIQKTKQKSITPRGRQSSVSCKHLGFYRDYSSKLYRSLTPTRMKHCMNCTSLLSLGLSTSSCLKHINKL